MLLGKLLISLLHDKSPVTATYLGVSTAIVPLALRRACGMGGRISAEEWRGTPRWEGLPGSEALRMKQRSGARETGWKGG